MGGLRSRPYAPAGVPRPAVSLLRSCEGETHKRGSQSTHVFPLLPFRLPHVHGRLGSDRVMANAVVSPEKRNATPSPDGRSTDFVSAQRVSAAGVRGAFCDVWAVSAVTSQEPTEVGRTRTSRPRCAMCDEKAPQAHKRAKCAGGRLCQWLWEPVAAGCSRIPCKPPRSQWLGETWPHSARHLTDFERPGCLANGGMLNDCALRKGAGMIDVFFSVLVLIFPSLCVSIVVDVILPWPMLLCNFRKWVGCVLLQKASAPRAEAIARLRHHGMDALW